MRVFIIGFMGSGKSKKGRKMATLLGMEFIDMDEWIEHSEGMIIPEIFKQKGEAYFRKVEYEALQNIITHQNVIVSTGGGSPCFFDSMERMNKFGITIYLKAKPAFLKERIKQSKKKRPLVENMDDAELLSYIETKLVEREKFYEKAQFSIEALGCRAKVLAELIQDSHLLT